MKYYRVWPDFHLRGRWLLGDARHIDNWILIKPPAWLMEPGDFEMDVDQQGIELDHSFAGYADASVVSERFRDALLGLPEVDEPHTHVVMQRVLIQGQETQQGYFVMLVETPKDCVDESRSEFLKYEANDPVRPDRSGQYRAFTKLVIDGAKADGRHIFRIAGHETALLFSEEVKRRLDRVGVTGIDYELVSQ